MGLGFNKFNFKKVVAAVLLALFTLNIFADSGLVKYELKDSHSSMTSGHEKIQSKDLTKSNKSSSEQCTDPCHTGKCHFGHCAHTIVSSYFAVVRDNLSSYTIFGLSEPDAPSISGLKRPPKFS